MIIHQINNKKTVKHFTPFHMYSTVKWRPLQPLITKRQMALFHGYTVRVPKINRDPFLQGDVNVIGPQQQSAVAYRILCNSVDANTSY